MTYGPPPGYFESAAPEGGIPMPEPHAASGEEAARNSRMYAQGRASRAARVASRQEAADYRQGLVHDESVLNRNMAATYQGALSGSRPLDQRQHVAMAKQGAAQYNKASNVRSGQIADTKRQAYQAEMAKFQAQQQAQQQAAQQAQQQAAMAKSSYDAQQAHDKRMEQFMQFLPPELMAPGTGPLLPQIGM